MSATVVFSFTKYIYRLSHNQSAVQKMVSESMWSLENVPNNASCSHDATFTDLDIM